MPVANRKNIEKLIYDTFDKLDPSGLNTSHISHGPRPTDRTARSGAPCG